MVLERMGYQFEIMNPDINESTIRFDDPKELTLAIAHAKATALLPKIGVPAILITADLVVVYNGEIREKPGSKKEAREFLKSYGKHPVETVTAVVVTNTETRKRKEGVDIAQVWLGSLPEEFIEEMMKNPRTFSGAGGFDINDPKIQKYIERIEGESGSIEGLPETLTRQFIEEAKTL